MAGQQKLVKRQNKSIFAQFQSIDFETIVASAFDDKNYAWTQYNIFEGTYVFRTILHNVMTGQRNIKGIHLAMKFLINSLGKCLQRKDI